MEAATAKRKQVTITADGACLGNGQKETRAAVAASLEYQGHKRAIACYIGPSTNQRAEITAAAFALESLKEPCTVILHTDSRYVVDTMTGKFKRRTNLDCWQRLDEAATPHETTYEWVRGHDGDPHQEAADKLARSTARLRKATELMLTETVQRLKHTITPALRDAVSQGLRYLAGHCDGARHRDGVGFNKFDAEYGHTLAAKETLNAMQIAAGRKLLRRYSNQLAIYSPALVAIL